MVDQVQVQRAYYAETASAYDGFHLNNPEHQVAISFFRGIVDELDIRSVLDVGAGTGRALLALQGKDAVQGVGLEPSPELRAIGNAKGLKMIDGDAQRMNFPSNSFDMVCEFGALHHMADPSKAIAEMIRVAKKAVFISDNHDYARGTPLMRTMKQSLAALGLWRLCDRIITHGKGYRITDDDGLWYSFSVFDHLSQINSACEAVHMLNTDGRGPNLYRTAGHIAILGIKRPFQA